MTVLNQQILRSQKRAGVYYYFLPTYRQAKAVIWDSLISNHIDSSFVEKKNDSELAIYYKNGSIQRFVGCEDIDKHRGINPVDVVFDEFSEMKEEIWTAIVQPVLAQNNGTATFIFTPKGKNHAWRLIQRANDNPDWFVSIKNNNDTHAISQEELEKIKKDTPMDLYQQEYMCSFVDNAGAFFKRVKENTYEGELEIGNGDYQIGVDLAKYADYTVITPFCLNDFKAHKQERFNQIDYNLQKAKIESAYLRYNKGDLCKVIIDSTGVGEPVFDDLNHQGILIEPYRFTEESRYKLLRNLQLLLEQDKIKIPNDQGLIDELSSFQYTISEQGRTKVKVPDGLHDDRVFSLALAVWGVVEPIENNRIGTMEQVADRYIESLVGEDNRKVWTDNFYDKYFT